MFYGYLIQLVLLSFFTLFLFFFLLFYLKISFYSGITLFHFSLKFLLVCFWPCWVFISLSGLSPAVASRARVFVRVLKLLISGEKNHLSFVGASLAVEQGSRELRLSCCGLDRAQLLLGTWNLPRPGIEPVSSAIAAGFLPTVSPGKSWSTFRFTEKLRSTESSCLPFTSFHLP